MSESEKAMSFLKTTKIMNERFYNDVAQLVSNDNVADAFGLCLQYIKVLEVKR